MDPTSSFVSCWLYKSKENCLILRTEVLKIRIQNRRLELFIKDEPLSNLKNNNTSISS